MRTTRSITVNTDFVQDIAVKMLLVIWSDQIIKNQQQNKFTAALFLDLSKAFDTLNHELFGRS